MTPGDAGTCRSRQDGGAHCTSSDQCASMVCGANGNCCEAACNTMGVCGATGCDATGACTGPSATTKCGAASCSGQGMMYVASGSGSCDGTGNCTPANPLPCPNNFSCADAFSCYTACVGADTTAGDKMCQAGYYCNGSACVAQSGPGGICTQNDQCLSGVCMGLIPKTCK